MATTFFPSLSARDQVKKAASGLGHLLSAAVISPRFQQTLLEDPLSALNDGYQGSRFELSSEERERILSAQAHSLAELVTKLTFLHE